MWIKIEKIQTNKIITFYLNSCLQNGIKQKISVINVEKKTYQDKFNVQNEDVNNLYAAEKDIHR